MKNSRLHISNEGLSVTDQEYLTHVRSTVNAKILELSLAYNKCKCDTCRIQVINKMEDIVNAELFYWNETLIGPIKAGNNIDMESLDNSIIHIIELQELIEKFNFIRTELLKK